MSLSFHPVAFLFTAGQDGGCILYILWLFVNKKIHNNSITNQPDAPMVRR